MWEWFDYAVDMCLLKHQKIHMHSKLVNLTLCAEKVGLKKTEGDEWMDRVGSFWF
jgi:hypothetical protein